MKALARWISIVAHPFVTAMVMVAGLEFHYGTARQAAGALLVVTAVALLPIAALALYKVHRGAWTNIDASNRSERPLLLGAGIVVSAALLGYGMLMEPDSPLIRGGIGVIAMLAACMIVVRWVKVSLHMAFATLAATSLLLLPSPLCWPLLAAIPLLAWSRLQLSRHTPLELIVGLLAGALTGYATNGLV